MFNTRRFHYFGKRTYVSNRIFAHAFHSENSFTGAFARVGSKGYMSIKSYVRCTFFN